MFPPRRILAAVDFSDCSRVALNAASRFAAQCGAQLVVLHAQDPLLAEAAKTAGVDLAAETHQELERFVRTAVASPDDAERLVVTGKAADVICHIAERESADVIVIGAHGMSGVAHAIFGSTTERVLRGTAMSVFVVPAAWTPPDPHATNLAGIGPVIAAVDLKSGSAAAATAASGLAALLHSSLEVIHVVPPITAPGRWSSHADRAIADAEYRASSELEILLRGLRRDVPTQVRVETGNVAQVLARAAAPEGPRRPLLVLGRNATKPRGSAPGAIAYRVLMQAEVPVLVYLPMD